MCSVTELQPFSRLAAPEKLKSRSQTVFYAGAASKNYIAALALLGRGKVGWPGHVVPGPGQVSQGRAEG